MTLPTVPSVTSRHHDVINNNKTTIKDFSSK